MNFGLESVAPRTGICARFPTLEFQLLGAVGEIVLEDTMSACVCRVAGCR